MIQTDIRHRISGIDITLLVDEAMDKEVNEQRPLLQKFSQGTAQVAIEKHHEYGRGFVYGEDEDEGQEQKFLYKFFYMTSTDESPLRELHRSPPTGARQKITELLHDYCPQSEAIFVIRLPPTLQVYIINQDQQMEMMFMEELEEMTF